MIEKLRQPENLRLLPAALIGAIGGMWKYFIISPLMEHLEKNAISQEELDNYIGEVGVTMFEKEENTYG